MPELNASGSILGAEANYQATDWAQAGANAQLDVQASAELKRGLDLELGAEALVGLDASVSKFLSVDLRGRASAAARVRAQVQVPLDLFDEAGLAIRLQAVAEAAAGVELGIGLNIGDFLALAGEDPRMRGIGLRMLRVLLAEAEIQGGVMAKAAAAAMAYANVACTGRLIPAVGVNAGFTVAAEAGMGLKAGAGFRVFANFGIAQPQRLIRKSVDVVVDETLATISQAIADPVGRSVIDELRAPAKMALRACFEVGAELARNDGQFAAGQGQVIAQRSVAVFLEEAQRYVLERLTELALKLFEEKLQAIGFNANTWNTAQPQRAALASELRNIPDDPFEPTQDNKNYWNRVLTKSVDLAVALGSQHQAAQPWMEPLSMVWAATQLLYKTVERISDTQARVSFLQSNATATVPAFTNQQVVGAPPRIAERINSTLRPGTTAGPLTQADLVAYLLRQDILNELIGRYPAVRVVVDVVGGPNADHIPALTKIFNNLGAFVSSGGGVDPEASLQVIVDGLASYVNNRLRSEFESVVRPALRDLNPEIELYLNEVLLDSLGFTLNTVFTQVLDWSRGSQTSQKALREACSAVVMKLCGRSLVVTADVLLNKALTDVSDGFRAAAQHLNQANGIVDELASLVPMLDRQDIKNAVEEIFDLAADTFEPLPAGQRARIRDLLYRVIDTAPASRDASLTDELRDDAFIPNGEAAIELAMELGILIRDLFMRLIQRILEMLARMAWEAIIAFIEDIERAITAWVAELEQFLSTVANTLLTIAAELETLRRQVTAAAGVLATKAEDFLGVLANNGQRSAMRDKGKALIKAGCMEVLNDIEIYDLLPSAAKEKVRDDLASAISAVVDNEITDDLFEALGTISGGLLDFIEEARDIADEDDVAGELIDRLVGRVEDAIRDQFGSRVSIPLSFRARFTYKGPRIYTLWGSFRPEISFDHTFNLGTIRIDIEDIVDGICYVASHLPVVTTAADDLADALVDCITKEFNLNAKEVEKENVEAHEVQSRRRVSETRDSVKTVTIIEPGAAAVYSGTVPIEIALTGVSESFLGTDGDDGEIQRIFVYLNQVEVDITRFNATQSILREPVTAIERVDAGISRGQHPLVTQIVSQHAGKQTRPTTRDRADFRSVSSGKMSVVGGKTKTNPSRSKQNLGRKPRPSAKKAAREEIKPGLTLKANLPKQEVRDGFNTLTVVIAVGNSEAQVSETVVFVAADPPKTKVTAPSRGFRGKVPTDLGIDPNLLNAALRGGLVSTAVVKDGKRKKATTLRVTQAPAEIAKSNRAVVERLTRKVNGIAKVRDEVKTRKIRRPL